MLDGEPERCRDLAKWLPGGPNLTTAHQVAGLYGLRAHAIFPGLTLYPRDLHLLYSLLYAHRPAVPRAVVLAERQVWEPDDGDQAGRLDPLAVILRSVTVDTASVSDVQQPRSCTFGTSARLRDL